MVQVGLVGLGRIARMFHLNALQAIPSVRLTALAERDSELLQTAEWEAPGAALCQDYSQLFARDDVDAVVICLPTTLHAEAAEAAFQAGKHVYLEKPLAMNAEEGDRVVAAWRASGRVGVSGFNFRFHPLWRQARRLLADGALGTLSGARTAFTGAARPAPKWKRSRDLGGGVLLDFASHHADALRYVFDDEIVEVQAWTQSLRYEQDTAHVTWRLSSGLSVQSFFSSNALDEHRFEAYGTRGKLSFERTSSAEVRIERPGSVYDPIHRIWNAGAGLAPSRLFRPGGEDSFRTCLEAFVEAVRNGQGCRPDVEDGRRSLAAVLAAEESARCGRPVTVEEPSG